MELQKKDPWRKSVFLYFKILGGKKVRMWNCFLQFSFRVVFNFCDLWLNQLELEASYWDDILSCLRNCQKDLMFLKISRCVRYNPKCLKINSSGCSHCSLTFHLSSCVLCWAKPCAWGMNPEGFRDLWRLCGASLYWDALWGKGNKPSSEYDENGSCGQDEFVKHRLTCTGSNIRVRNKPRFATVVLWGSAARAIMDKLSVCANCFRLRHMGGWLLCLVCLHVPDVFVALEWSPLRVSPSL